MSSRLQRELALLVTGKDVSASRVLGNVDRRVSSLERHMGKAGRNMARNLEHGIVLGATAAAGAIGYTVKAAMDWESAFAGVRKTVEGTPEQLEALADGLRSMSREMPVTATELAAIAENAGALGIAREDILEFTRTVAMIGATTDVSTDQASTALGQLGNVMDLTSDDYRGFAAALVDLGNKGASTEAQILEIARRAGGSAALIGLAKDETLGWAAAAANLGMNEELAGTSLQRMFVGLMPQYTKGSKALQEATGQTAAQLKRAFRRDAGGAIESLMRNLGKMPKDKRLKAVQDLFGKGTGLTRLVLGLADSVDKNLTPALETSVHAWGEGEAAAAEYEKRVQTTESQLALFKNSVNDAAVTIGTNLLPVMVELAQEGTAWIDEHQDEIAQFGKDLANGFRDAVTWAQSLDWEAITDTLKAGAGVAKGIVEAFTSAPPWLQQFLAAGFVANKFTGGVIGDVIGEAAKGLIKGVLGINAGVVNVRGAVVNGGGGLPGGMNAPTGGAAGIAPDKGPMGVLGTAVVGLTGAAALIGIQTAISDGYKSLNPWNNQELTNAIANAPKDFWSPGLDALMNLDKIPDALRSELSGIASAIAGIAGNPGTGANPGTVANDPTGFLNSGPMQSLLKTAGDTHSEQLATTRAVDGVSQKQAESLVAFRAGERTSATGLANTTSAARGAGVMSAMAAGISASRIVAAISSSRPVVNVSVTGVPNPTVRTTYGKSSGSAKAEPRVTGGSW